MNRLLREGTLILSLGLFGSLAACADAASEAEAQASEAEAVAVAILDGPCRPVHGAEVCTWARQEGDRIVEVGANIPLASVENADPEAPFLWPPVDAATIPMPDAVRDRLGILDLKIYWESHGHPPGPFMVPHFDYHFYVKPPADVAAMDCTDTTKPESLPAGYALPDIDIPELGYLIGLCVPEMGMHALPAAQLEGEEPFERSMVIGYYAGEPIFFEPMIAQDLLTQRRSFGLDMPRVTDVPPGVVLPTAFEAVYNDMGSSYSFVFSGFPTG